MASLTATELKQRTLAITESLCTKRDFLSPGSAAQTLLHEKFTHQHDSDPWTEPGKEHFLEHWKMVLEFIPDFKTELIDIIAEVNGDRKGGKVWTFSRVTGLPGGQSKDSVDMFKFDENGLATSFKDVQRAL